MKTFRPILPLILVLISLNAFGQVNTSALLPQIHHDTLKIDSSRQRDIVDVYQHFFYKDASPEKRTASGAFNLSIIPYVGYSLSTGAIADVSSNAGFYTSFDHHQNLSVITSDIGFDSKLQKIFRVRSEIWGSDNELKIVSDLRFDIYPTDTYGLGTFSKLSTDNDIDYHYIRVYETVYKKISGSYYLGAGYNLDDHYDITASGDADGTVSDFEKYGQPKSSVSSGFNISLLFDNRKNPINPLAGTYACLIFRENLIFLGSDNNWQLIKADFRKYIRLSPNSNDILAIWCIAAFTSGYAPYLDLPATGSDMYNNSGRGYAIGRYRGKNELYAEAEYRFGITENGLIGAVVFANAESFSGLHSSSFEGVAPAAGPGLRIKVNKHSNSNVCVDYGVGINGSRGLFVGLGEVF